MKHPLACVQVAERARRVVHRASEDVWTVGVAPYASFRGETRKPFTSRIVGHSAIEEVEARERRENEERENQTRRPFNQTPDIPTPERPFFAHHQPSCSPGPFRLALIGIVIACCGELSAAVVKRH